MIRTWRVRRGIKFLDKHIGRDVWLSRVHVDYIDVRDGENCPLAQATGTMFWKAARRLGFDDTHLGEYRLIMLGFLNLPMESYGSLDVVWRREITALQSTRELVDA